MWCSPSGFLCLWWRIFIHVFFFSFSCLTISERNIIQCTHRHTHHIVRHSLSILKKSQSVNVIIFNIYFFHSSPVLYISRITSDCFPGYRTTSSSDTVYSVHCELLNYETKLNEIHTLTFLYLKTAQIYTPLSSTRYTANTFSYYNKQKLSWWIWALWLVWFYFHSTMDGGSCFKMQNHLVLSVQTHNVWCMKHLGPLEGLKYKM